MRVTHPLFFFRKCGPLGEEMRGFSTRLTIVVNYVTCVTFFLQILAQRLHFFFSEYLSNVP